MYRIESTVLCEDGELSRGPYAIVAANHMNRLDPILIFAALPFSLFRRVIPCKAFTANWYIKYFGIVLRPLGAFPAYSRAGGKSGLREGLRSLDNNFNVLIFPEGRLNRKEEQLGLKIAAAYVARKMSVPLLPVRIKKDGSATKIVWGRPFRIDRDIHSLEELNSEIFRRVLSLGD